jgi:maltooligosyltrehalose trehalohydrolase
VWADDFHHLARRITAGDRDGYYQDFSNEVRDLAATIRRGWFFTGQPSAYLGEARGTDPSGIRPERMVICVQNHDQIGNRAFGERLHHTIDAGAFCALVALLLCAPETPLLFMGQEWAASSPFLFFTDHEAGLGRLVTGGRRHEFARFEAFRDEASRARIPDPQARETFEASRLRWDERDEPAHAPVLAWHRALLALRRSAPALSAGAACVVTTPDDDSIVMRRESASGDAVVVAVLLRGAGEVDLSPSLAPDPHAWSIALQTGATGADRGLVHFDGPGAVLFRRS